MKSVKLESMKELEKIFRDNREDFDNQEPQEAHLDNFLGKLKQNPKKRRWSSMPNFLKVAAIITFVIFSGVVGYQIRSLQSQPISLGNISPEYREVELFYTSNINSQLTMIEKLGSFDNTEHQQILSEELQDMDEKYNQLKKELELHPDDDRIIEAMIEYYQVKTNVLNRIIEQLYQVRKQTKSNLNVSA